MEENPRVQEASAEQTSFDAVAEGWDAEIQSIEKRVGRRQAIGGLIAVASLVPLLIALGTYDWTAGLVAGVAIVAAAALFLHARKIRREAVPRLTGEIQRTCQDKGLEKSEVVKTLYQKKISDVRAEILRAVQIDTLRALLKREVDGAISGSRRAPVSAPTTGAATIEDVAWMVKAGDVKGLSAVFQRTGSWDTRETVVVALQNIVWGKGGRFDRDEMVRALSEIEQVCATESGGGSYRTNCLDTARKLLAELTNR